MHILTNRYFIIALILAVPGIIISIYAWQYPLFPPDLPLTLLFQSFINPTLTAIFSWISCIFGGWHAALLVIPAGLLIWWLLGQWEGLMIPLAGLISLMNDYFKVLINRPRPTTEQVQVLITETNKGFPSGHAFFSMIFLGMLAYLLYTHLTSKNLRILSTIIFALLILAVGSSRVYLGVHWTSDVLGGYIIGGFFLTLLIWLYEWQRARSGINKNSSGS